MHELASELGIGEPVDLARTLVASVGVKLATDWRGVETIPEADAAKIIQARRSEAHEDYLASIEPGRLEPRPRDM